MKNIYILYLLTLLVLINGCSSELDNERNTLNFLMLNECKELSLDFFDNLKNTHDIDFTYKKFNFNIPSHSEVVGFITLSSNTLGKDDLETYINRIWIDCYPNSISEGRINSSKDYDDIIFLIDSNINSGKTHQYIKFNENRYQVFFNNRLKVPE